MRDGNRCQIGPPGSNFWNPMVEKCPCDQGVAVQRADQFDVLGSVTQRPTSDADRPTHVVDQPQHDPA